MTPKRPPTVDNAENTLITPGDLFEDLERTKSRGYSFDQEERYTGMSCIGSVIYDEHQEACAGVSISGPSTRFDAMRVAELGAAVTEAAVEITRLIGGRLPVGHVKANTNVTLS